MSGNKMKVLLLAPPGNKLYMRDQYCSTTSKGEYYWPPSDLLIQSGILKKYFKLFVLDAIAEKLSFEETTRRIKNLKPDAIISLSSSISLKTDMPFLRMVKEAISCKIIMSGDIFYFEPKKMMEEFDFIDGIMLCYISNDSVKFLNEQYTNLKNFCYRKNGKIIVTEKESPQNYKHPPPTVDLFPYQKYTYPLMRRKPMSASHTSFGCPYKCVFCPIGLVPFSFRDIEDTLDELKYLHSKGIKELFIKDATFNVDLERTKRLLKMMINKRFGFTWTCSMTVNNVDEELLRLLKKAGCQSIMFGVESGSKQILEHMHKGTTPEKIKNVFEICNKLKIRTLAHFIIGFPKETLKTAKETIRFAKEIKCNFATFNLYVPRMGTVTRKELIGKEIKDDVSKLDSSGENIESYCNISKDSLIRLRNKAYLSFYTNPGQIWRMVGSIKTLTEISIFLKNFLKVFTGY